MKNSLRLLVLSGMLAVLASPAAFADGGPGGSAPPVGGSGGGTTTSSTVTGTSSASTVLGTIISILGAVGF